MIPYELDVESDINQALGQPYFETEYHINRLEKAGVKLINILVGPACCKRGIIV
jgi:hypothetical protein